MEIEYSKDLHHNYMRIRGQVYNGESSYSLKMLEAEGLCGILKPDCRRQDDCVYYYYNITAKQSMMNLFTKAPLSGIMVKHLILRLVETTLRAYEYLLDEKGFVISPETIFLDLNTDDYELCYLPCYGIDVKEQMCSLLEFMMNKVDYNDKEAVLLVYNLYAAVREEEYTFDHLLRILRNPEQSEPAIGRSSGSSSPGYTSQHGPKNTPKNSPKNTSGRSPKNTSGHSSEHPSRHSLEHTSSHCLENTSRYSPEHTSGQGPKYTSGYSSKSTSMYSPENTFRYNSENTSGHNSENSSMYSPEHITRYNSEHISRHNPEHTSMRSSENTSKYNPDYRSKKSSENSPMHMRSRILSMGRIIPGRRHRNPVLTMKEGLQNALPKAYGAIPVMPEKLFREQEAVCYPLKTYLYTAACILAAILILFLCIKTKLCYRPLGHRIDYTKLFAILLILFCCSGYLIMRLWDKKNRITKMITICEYRDPMSATEIGQSVIRREEETPEIRISSDTAEIPRSQEESIRQEITDVRQKPKEEEEEVTNPTCLLNAAGPDHCCKLRPLEEAGYETITIADFPFFIGKLRKNVDYCLKKEVVSRYHAKITREEDKYFLTDLNSTNGTFLNGEALMTYQQREIKSGDEISFANIRYQFMV